MCCGDSQIFPGFLLNFSFSRKTGPTSWHLPTLLPFFSLLPSLALLQHPAGQGRQSGPWPLEALGSGSRGASPQQAGPANSSIQVFASDVRSLGCPDEKSSLDKLLALCSQAALGFLSLQVAVSESRDQRSEAVVLDFFSVPLGKVTVWARAMLSVGSYLNQTGWGWCPEPCEEAGLGTHSRPILAFVSITALCILPGRRRVSDSGSSCHYCLENVASFVLFRLLRLEISRAWATCPQLGAH